MGRGLVFVSALLAILGAGLATQGSDKVFRVGISQIVEHPALDATRKGFMKHLEENGYAEG
jgi:putative ABC transport system substrate-binding protein